MKIFHTRRSKILTGILVIVLVAVLVMGFGTGLPGSGLKFTGSACYKYDYGTSVELMSDWLGACTGVITITNTHSDVILITGWKHIGGDIDNRVRISCSPAKPGAMIIKGSA